MNIVAALLLCKSGISVRPVAWKHINPNHYVVCRNRGEVFVFVEAGPFEEMVHALMLQREDELLGEWEVV